MKIFKSTNNNTTFINQLLDVINSNTMRSIINKYSGDYRSQSFDTYSHFFTMMYLQLNESKTLRCCITELENDIDIDSNVYVPSLSQLSRKNSTRNYRIFEDIFYYVYGILHSTEYRTSFAADLKKMLPRIPLVDEALDFWSFSKAGRNLAELHLNYENRPSATGVIVTYNTIPQSEIEKVMQSGEMETINYQVEKMRFPSKTDKSKIIYNSQITIENIPATAYEYIVNGKSAIEWIMERYAVITHKDSGITNNPNDWATEHDNPRYILDLLLSVILLSIEMMEIVNGLPKLTF